MEQDQDNFVYGRQLMEWIIPSYTPHERGPWWFLIFSGFAGLMIIFSLFAPNFLFDQPNYLFAVIIILSGFIFVSSSFSQPQEMDVIIGTEGLLIAGVFYDYDVFKDFCVLYKPSDNVASIYFEFKNVLRPRLSVPLQEANPLAVRQLLLRYLTEDLERTDEPSTEFLGKILKI